MQREKDRNKGRKLESETNAKRERWRVRVIQRGKGKDIQTDRGSRHRYKLCLKLLTSCISIFKFSCRNASCTCLDYLGITLWNETIILDVIMPKEPRQVHLLSTSLAFLSLKNDVGHFVIFLCASARNTNWKGSSVQLTSSLRYLVLQNKYIMFSISNVTVRN